jgi:hypothetical protein
MADKPSETPKAGRRELCQPDIDYVAAEGIYLGINADQATR